ncbi:MAG: MMPL family transporter [Crocinitomicaceae bacterium]|nr:MMPL family transporter [Crocinitomicaceae bacterium]
MKKIAEPVFRKIAFVSLLLAAAVTISLAYYLPSIQLDYNFEDFYPANDDESQFFYEYRTNFESDNDFLLLAITNQGNDVLEEQFLYRLHNLTDAIAHIDMVKDVRSIINTPIVRLRGPSVTVTPIIDLGHFQREFSENIILSHPRLTSFLISDDLKSLCLFIDHQDFLSKEKSDRIVEDIRNTLEAHNITDFKMAGRTVGQLFYIDIMTNELRTYVGLSLLLVIIILWIAFRSIWGVIIPMIVVVGSTVWIIGWMAFRGEPFNILLTILPPIMFVVAVSDVIHLVSKYIELLRDGKPKLAAIQISFKEIGWATLLTSLTTAIGFFSLLFVNVQPIQVFGKFVGIGVLMAFCLTFMTLPFLFYFTKTPRIVRENRRNFWRPIMQFFMLWTLRHRRVIPWVVALFLAVFIYGAYQVKTNNFIMDDIRDGVPMKADFAFFDEHFAGIRPFEMAVQLRDTSLQFWDKVVLDEMARVENYLEKEYGVAIRMSLIRAIQLLDPLANTSVSDTIQQIPPWDNVRAFRNYKRAILSANEGQLWRSIVNENFGVARIAGNIPDWGSIVVQEKNDGLYTFLSEELKSEILVFQPTGSAHLLDKNMRYLSGSLIQGLAFAILVVSMLMGFLFRSISMVIIAMIPNILPLVFIAGFMGFTGIDLKITTAIVFTISFGIAVDDTIHFLSKFNLELKKGKSPLYALKRTYFSTGKAILLTSAVLCSGFLLLLLSDFLGTFYLGLMITLTLFFAIVADLLLLPILLNWWILIKKKWPYKYL